MTHLDLIDAVNDAKTQHEHDIAEAVLRGFRMGVDLFCGWQPRACDMHTMARFGEDRPMCCGVLLDWMPAQ